MWMQEVRQAAELCWPDGEPPTSGNVMLSITYVYNGRPIDVDNVPKPILDALKGLVFLDDRQVTDMHCRRRNLYDNLVLMDPSNSLRQAVVSGTEVVQILVSDAPDQRIID